MKTVVSCRRRETPLRWDGKGVRVRDRLDWSLQRWVSVSYRLRRDSTSWWEPCTSPAPPYPRFQAVPAVPTCEDPFCAHRQPASAAGRAQLTRRRWVKTVVAHTRPDTFSFHKLMLQAWFSDSSIALGTKKVRGWARRWASREKLNFEYPLRYIWSWAPRPSRSANICRFNKYRPCGDWKIKRNLCVWTVNCENWNVNWIKIIWFGTWELEVEC